VLRGKHEHFEGFHRWLQENRLRKTCELTLDSKENLLPTIEEIRKAQDRIAGVASITPLVDSPSLSKRYGMEIFLKLECFQPIRVFKIRGAYNKLRQTSEKKIIAVSSGNHGIAVAYASRALGKKCTVILPEDAVQEKVDSILEYGAQVIKFGKYHIERDAKARELVKSTGALYVHPFNDFDVIAGQGTCGAEVASQLDDFDSVLVPVGGGGLISGIAIALKSLKPKVKIFGVEPAVSPKLSTSLNEQKLVSVPPAHTIADGIMSSTLGDLTFDACSKYVDGVYSVSEEEILSAMKILIKQARIFPEPASAATLAAIVANKNLERLGRRVVLIISGGNVSQKLLSQLLV
jgi:threonine dehydratase